MQTVDEIIAAHEHRIRDWAVGQADDFSTDEQRTKFSADVDAVVGLVHDYGVWASSRVGVAEHTWWRDRKSFPAKAFFAEINHWRKRQAKGSR